MPSLHIAFRRPLSPPGRVSAPLVQRCFSYQAPLRAALGQQQPPQPSMPASRSMRALSKEVQEIPSDVGILDNTFITPTGRNAPSLFQSPLSLFKLQFRRLLFRFRDQFSLIVFKFSSPKENGFLRRSVKLSRSTITPTAVALHRQMYSSFAEGDIPAIRKICADGIYDSFRARIGSRPRGEVVRWELVKYNKSPKLVSNRAARFPIEGAAIRQAVIRICSTQKLTRMTKSKGGAMIVVPGSGKEKDVVEYVVLQRTYASWKEGPWQVWGTTGETTTRDLLEWDKRALE